MLSFLNVITRYRGVKHIPSNYTKGLPLSWYSLYDYRWDPQAHGYTVVAFHPEIMIYIFPKDGSGKGIVLNINHGIVPQAIGIALTGVSHNKEDKSG